MKFYANIPTWLWVLINLSQVTFIALKLFNIITWSWFWILCPIWTTMGFIYITWLICSITVFFKKIGS